MQKPEPGTVPLAPGVYLYKDARGKIIYIGKAKCLRKRVLSYFHAKGQPAKTAAMLKRAASIDFITATTEKEALLLEASLIKKHRPHYNIVLRDDKHYVLFRINPKSDFPRLEITRKVKRDGSRYFGPFTSAYDARETWKLLNRTFSLRRCTDRSMKNRVRPCLYYHIGQCPAPCMQYIKKEEYHKSVKKICDLLSGNAGFLVDDLKKEMEIASENLDFERAAVLRDQIRAVERTVEKQAAILPGAKDMDAIGLYSSEKGLSLGIIFVRNGAAGDSRAFYWPGLTFEDAPELLSSFLVQFYTYASPPPRILLPWLPDEDSDEFAFGKLALEQIFTERRGGQVHIITPQSSADNQLIDLAQANAKEEARRRQGLDITAILEKIAHILGLPYAPLRIECADVSHISGNQTRVGLVVYEDGRPMRDDWRIYAMPDSADDCATLHDWVFRRLESGSPWPDLLLIDGGRGQLAAVKKAMQKAGEENLFHIAAIAKARDDRGRPDRRAGNVADRIFTPGRVNPMPFKDASPELLLLQQIRDATHQFSVHGHRRARRSAAFSGELMRLPGIGPATARLLWDKFQSLEAMSKTTEEELSEIPGIGKAKAKQLAEKLRNLELNNR